MAINFPNSPNLNELYSYDNKTWEWNGIYWEVYSGLTSYITSAYTVGNGYSVISGVTDGDIALKSFSGVNITIIDDGDKLTFSGSQQQNVSGYYLPLSGGTVTGATRFTGGLTGNTIVFEILNYSWTNIVVGSIFSYFNNTIYVNETGKTHYFGGGPLNVQNNLSVPNGSLQVGGNTLINSGLTANTISATTYFNLPTDIRVTGGTYSGSTIIFTNNTGGTFSVTGITTSSSFTGGTVSGATEFTGGLTANTISATTITSPSISPYGLIVATSLGYQNIF